MAVFLVSGAMTPSSGTNYVLLFAFIVFAVVVAVGAATLVVGARRRRQRLGVLEKQVFGPRT